MPPDPPLLLALAGVLLSAGMGLLSALVPFVNAELYAVAVSTQTGPGIALLCAVALAVGQTAGKWLWYLTGRAGGERAARWRTSRSHGDPPDPGRVARLVERLRDRRSSAAVVLLSGSVGLPPLALVAVAAGVSRMRVRDFLACCLVGRTVRFCVVLLPLALHEPS